MPEEDAILDETPGFPHLDHRGNARMVDVTAKATTARRAVARCRLVTAPETRQALARGDAAARELLASARTAGMMAAKRTAELLPLCHPILLGDITVELLLGPDGVEVAAAIEAHDRTGVEMEALTACLAAALTLYAAWKSHDRLMAIEGATVLEKAGGRSGTWRREGDRVVHEAGG